MLKRFRIADIHAREFLPAKIILVAALLFLPWLHTDTLAHAEYGRYLARLLPYYFFESMLLSLLLARLRFDPWITALVLLAGLPQVHFLTNTNLLYLAPDIKGHMDYILYLLHNSFIPPFPSGWQRQQPFLYYEWIAAAFRLGEWLDIRNGWFPARVASRMLYLGFVVFSLLLIRRFKFPRLASYAAMCVVIFGPSSYLMSTRINSDIGFLFFFMGAIYFMQCWYETLVKKQLMLAIIFAGLSLLCKGSGVISLTVLAIIIVHAFATKRIDASYLCSRALGWSYLVVAICLAGYFGRIGYYNIFENADLRWFANVHKGQVPYTPAQPSDFITFHLWDFLQAPGFGRLKADQNFYTFWDGLFRTLLYDENLYHPFLLDDIMPVAYILSSLWLLLVLLAASQIVRHAFHLRRYEYSCIVIALVCLIGMTMMQRWVLPDHYMYHARRIYPMLTLIAILAAAALQQVNARGYRTVYIIGVSLCFVFAAASLVLMVHHLPAQKKGPGVNPAHQVAGRLQ